MSTATSFLYIMRHAKAALTRGGDHDRMLTDRGRQDSRSMGRKIMSSGFTQPQKVLVSSALRTRETAMCLSLSPPPVMEISHALYNGNEQTCLDKIRCHNIAALLVIGHNPGLSYLLHSLCKPEASCVILPDSLPTASVAIIELSVPFCLCGPRTGRLVAFLTPAPKPEDAFSDSTQHCKEQKTGH